MSEPQTACDEEKCWEAIDIFLFSNGEQHSPPRKYHLKLDELRMWDETLANLGRSQFGSQYTNIEIYTIDGKKIEGPPQLSHESAYVAVKPPCTFIQAGYKKYLIKATRSWEKRVLKLSNSIESSVKDDNQNVISKVGSNANINIRACSPSNKKETPNTLNINKNKTSIMKPSVVNTNKPQRCIKAAKYTPNKQVQIKKTPNTPEVTKLQQAIMPFKIPSNTKKVPIKMKESFYKKPLHIKKIFSASSQARNTPKKSCNQNNPVPSTTITSLNFTEKSQEKIVTSKKITLTNQSLEKEKESKRDHSVINDEKMVTSNIYDNPEHEILSVSDKKYDDNENFSSENTDITKVKLENTSNDYTKTKYNVTSLYNNEIASLTETDSSIQKPCIVSIDIQKSNPTNQSCCASLKQIDHFLAVTNNDKIFKMQLNLEVANCNVHLTTEKQNTINNSHSKTNLTKEEKDTQVNIDQHLCGTFEHDNVSFLQLRTEDLRSTGDVAKNVNNEDKVILIHCSCCDCIDLRHILISNMQCNNMLKEKFVHELASAIKEGTKRCDCDTFPSKTKHNVCPKTDSFVTPDFYHDTEKALTVTSVHKLTSSDPVSVPYKIATKEQVFLNGETGKAEFSAPTSDRQQLKELINRNTQTTWCNTVLEARRHEDGRYTFHVPSLNKIKKYGI